MTELLPRWLRLAPAPAFRLAAATGFLAVACGAFGAHGLKGFFAQPQHVGAAEWWEKAVFYHFIHAVVLLLLPLLRPFPAGAYILCGLGIAGFSGSLYLLALTGLHWLVFVTPVGGLCLLGSWLALCLGAGRTTWSEAAPEP